MNSELRDIGHWQKTLKIRQKSMDLVNRKWGTNMRSPDAVFWFSNIVTKSDRGTVFCLCVIVSDREGYYRPEDQSSEIPN